MKRNWILAAAISAVCVGGAYAAETKPMEQFDAAQPYTTHRSETSAYGIRASDLIGQDVVNAANEEIGEVDDVVISRGDGSTSAVISVGGFLGLGDRLVAVPVDELRVSSDGETIFLDTSEEALKAREPFKYNDGEPAGKQRWEKRLELRGELEEEQQDVAEAKRELEEEQKDVEEVQKKLTEVKQ